MKNSFKKTIASLVAVIALAVPMGVMSVSAATMANTGDFSGVTAPPGISGSYVKVTNGGSDVILEKDTHSSISVYIGQSAYSLSVQTWGISSDGWSDSDNCTLNDAEEPVTSIGVGVRTTTYIKNSVYEDHYDYASLKLRSTNYYNSCTVAGTFTTDTDVGL